MTPAYLPDLGDGTYRNPVIHADYSDPDVIRAGDDFWMTASSFQCTPGLPILHSKDLVNWTLVNHAVRQLPHPRYAAVVPGGGIWAPAIRHHDGWFWIFFPMPDEGIYATRTRDPRGAWEEPWLVQQARGWIDPCPFWDDDGTAYLAHGYAFSKSGLKERIHLRPMSPDGRRLLGEGAELFHTPHHLYLEGPKVHKMDGWYYILCPGGGVPTGWQVAFRSKQIWGPYEEKVVLERGSTPVNGPHQGALVDLDDPASSRGEWWFLHFQDAGPYGRITHLQPVHWQNGWPLMGIDHDGNGVGEPVATHRKPRVTACPSPCAPATTDEFDGATPGLQWQWHANHDPAWADLASRPGWLRLAARPVPDLAVHLAPHFLGQKFPARAFAVCTLIDTATLAPGVIAGLAVLGGGTHALLGVRRLGGACEVVQILGGALCSVGGTPASRVRIDLRVDPNARCTMAWAADDGAATPAPEPFHASAGGWIGAKAGLLAIATADGALHADFDYFRVITQAPA
jgi:beta-xylosidase